MDQQVNHAMVAGFIADAKGYLPRILEALDTHANDPADHAALEEAYRLVHTIRGASSIVGFTAIKEDAAAIEHDLERVGLGERMLDAETIDQIQQILAEIDSELDRRAIEAGSDPSAWSGDDPFASEDEETFGDSGAVQASDVYDEDEPDRTEEIPAELMEVFVIEAQDHLQTIARTLSTLSSAPDDRDTLQELRRSVHTLKGAAGMVGFRTVSKLSHRMEDLLDALYDGLLSGTAETSSLLLASADMLHDLVSGDADQDSVRPVIQALYTRYTAVLSTLPAADPAALAHAAAAQEQQPLPSRHHGRDHGVSKPSVAALAGQDVPALLPHVAAPVDRRKIKQHVRVPIERLDDLINLVGELVIKRSAFHQYFLSLTAQLEELGQSVTRLRLLWSKLETEYEVGTPSGRGNRLASDLAARAGSDVHGFDELEFDQYTELHLLSRQLSETVGDIDAVQRQLRESVGSFEGDYAAMRRLTLDAQDRLLRLRMVPVGSLTTRLERVVRVTAENLGKQVDFVLEGDAVALDKPILEEVSNSLLHVLRNAVDHGIESPPVRAAMGKPERAKITVSAAYEGAHALIQVRDDGRGLDVAALRAAAIREGYITPEEAPALADRDLYAFIFRPKFSTAREISETSGRGVGLDVVKEKLQQMNGTVTVESVAGKGATFTLRLPLTLAVARVLLVKAGPQIFAVPATAIGRVLRLDREDVVEENGEMREVRLQGESYPAVQLVKALGLRTTSDEVSQRVAALILNSSERPAALLVDQMLETRDVVVSTLTGHLRRVRGLAGATVLGDGRVVLILNPDDVVGQQQEPDRFGAQQVRQPVVVAEEQEPLKVLIVDDSLSVR